MTALVFIIPFQTLAETVTDDDETEESGIPIAGEEAQPSEDDEELPVEETPNAEIDYFNEKLTGLEEGEHTLSVGDVSYPVSIGVSGQTGIDGGWIGETVYIVKNGDGALTSDSEAQALTLPARPAAPYVSGSDIIAGTSPVTGNLSGVTALMEYRSEHAGIWIPGPDSGNTVAGILPGVYLVRLKATENSFAGNERRVVVAVGSVTVIKGNNTVFKGSGSAVFELDARYLDFWRLLYSGMELTEGRDYSVSEGSTIIVFSNAYLKSLPKGKHTFRAEWIESSGAVIFAELKLQIAGADAKTINDPAADDLSESGLDTDIPRTADDSGAFGWASLCIISFSVILLIPAAAYPFKKYKRSPE